MRKSLTKIILVIMVVALGLYMTGCADDSQVTNRKENTGTQTADEKSVTIGSKDFTENLIVAELYALALEDKGYQVKRNFNIASSVVHQAIISGEVDLYPEYTGTGLLSILKLPLVTDPQKVYDTVKTEYSKRFQLAWLAYSPANDSQGLVINRAIAEKLGIATISDLQKKADQIRFASQGEFNEREDGLPALEAAYGPFHFKAMEVFDNSLKYEVLSNNKADLAVAYTTEGPLVDKKYLVLTDDKKVWPPYNLAPVIRQSVLDRNPEIETILNKLSACIDTETITRLNAKVDVEKGEFEEVAREYYDTIK